MFVLRNSERTLYRRCRQAWWWAYVDCLKPIEIAAPLRFGSLIHEALAVWYKPGTKRGRKPWITFKKLYEDELKDKQEFGMFDIEDEWQDAFDLGVEMLKNYYQQYGNDERYKIIAPEAPFEIDFPGFVFVGTFDAIIQDLETGKYGLFEHKTAKAISTDHLWSDEQAGAYWAVADTWLKHLGLDLELDFVLYNFLRKGKRDARPTNESGQYLNKDGTVSKNQPPELFKREIVLRSAHEKGEVLKRIQQEADEMMMVLDERLPVRKNFTRECSWCDFQKHSGMCELHEIGSDWESVRDTMYKKWDPYGGHDFEGDDGS